MKLSVIIISFNTQEMTRQCLVSLKDLTDVKLNEVFEVIVVDNGSVDGSAQMISHDFPEVKLIETGENLGFSKGNNVGITHISAETEYVLFLNSDTVVPNGTFSEMVSFMQNNPDVGVSTCRVDLFSGGIDMDCHRGFPTPWVSFTRLTGLYRLFPKDRLLNGYYLGDKDLSKTHEVDAVVGAFMFVRRGVGEKIGWWDEDYFLNGEDIDFCFCVKELGYKVVYHPAVSITHYRGASKGTRSETSKISKVSLESKKRVAGASIDAMKLFYDKHLRSRYPRSVGWMVDSGLRLLRWNRLRRFR